MQMKVCPGQCHDEYDANAPAAPVHPVTAVCQCHDEYPELAAPDQAARVEGDDAVDPRGSPHEPVTV